MIKAAIASGLPGSILPKTSATLQRVSSSLVADRIVIKAAIASGLPGSIFPKIDAASLQVYLSGQSLRIAISSVMASGRIVSGIGFLAPSLI